MKNSNQRVALWQLFRPVFLVFSLYLLGDAFFRWDGFKFYGSFSEFLHSVALVSILWSIISVLTTLVMWVILKAFEMFCHIFKIRANQKQILFFISIVAILMGTVWVIKKMIFPEALIAFQLKLALIVSVILVSFLLAWLFRNLAVRCITTINESITPLVWLFIGIVLLSLPLVIYDAARGKAEKEVPWEAIEASAANMDLPNIIMVTFDALTSRNMSVYGYHKETTPFIADWAESATVFTRSEAAGNTTSQTVASLMTGKHAWSHRRYQSDAGKSVNIENENMPLLLKDRGYYNMAFTANGIASVEKMGISDSFHVKPSYSKTISPKSFYGFLVKYLFQYFGAKVKLYDWILKEDFILDRILPGDYFKYPHKTEFPVKKVFDMFFEEIDNNPVRPYFAWIHLYPPHAPYLPPKKYVGMFDPTMKFRTAISQYRLLYPRYFPEGKRKEAEILENRYNEFIRYCDKEFEYFIEQLAERKILKDTVVILSSDHGESFSHGFFTHGGQILYEDLTNIPLIIKEPFQDEGRTVEFPVAQIDISATILELANVSVPPWVDGRSLVPVLRGEVYDPSPVFSMNLEGIPVRGLKWINKGIIAVWEGDFKLIYYIEQGEALLFNLKKDPEEQDNLIDKELEVGRHLLGVIKDNLKMANKKIHNDR